jgi:hypothetical protein
MAITDEVEGPGNRDEHRKLLELQVRQAVRDWWHFSGMPARASFPVPEAGIIITVQVEP